MSAAMDRLVERHQKILIEDNPTFATFLGIHDHDDELGDFTADAHKERHRHLRTLLDDLDALDLSNADIDARIDARALSASLRRQVFEHEELCAYRTRPSRYVSTALSGCHNLIVGDFAPIEGRARSLLGRLRQVPDVLSAMEENIENPPGVFASVEADVARGGVGFVSAVIPGVAAEVPALASELTEAGSGAAEAFERAAQYLDAQAEASETSFHVGRERYEWILREYHLLDLDSAELRDTGRRVLDETKSKMATLAREIDADKTWHEIIEDLKTAHPPAGGLREHYASEMARARDFVRREDLVSIPDGEELEVIDTPIFARKLLPYAAYHPAGPFEAKQRGLFYVTPVDETLTPEEQERQLRGHSIHTIPVIALHEAYPGHHLQLVRSNGVSHKARRILWNNVFIEGWALYCEEMMKEAGFYSDARARISQLKETLWRAARVVVDVGLQLGEMSVDEAIDFMMSEVALERINATAEVRRYTANPTQPSSYLLGKLAILDIRARYEAREGSAFDLKTFHDALLDVGSIQPRLAEVALGLTE